MRFLLILLTLLFLPTLLRAAADPPCFPVMIWNFCPPDPATVADLKDCGVTVAGFVYPKDVPAITAAGLRVIVTDPRTNGYDWLHPLDLAAVKKNVDSLVAETKNNPAVLGYYLRDEPTTPMFSSLGIVAAALRAKSPDIWPYIDLFPIQVAPKDLGAQSYNDYLEQFIAACHPPILAFDHYPLHDNGSADDTFFPNLEVFRRAGLKHHLPFWSILQSEGVFDLRIPTEADLRFQVYSSLAYGARGIAWFTYFCPAVGNHRGAPIDPFGHKTPTWEHLRSVNLQIKTLAPTLLQLTSTKVYHFAKTADCPLPDQDSLLVSADPNFLAGEFKHTDGSDYLLLVNKDVTHSHPANTLQWRTPPQSVRLVSPYINDATFPFEGEQLWLAPGAGALLKIAFPPH